jgi:hypothetical protein
MERASASALHVPRWYIVPEHTELGYGPWRTYNTSFDNHTILNGLKCFALPCLLWACSFCCSSKVPCSLRHLYCYVVLWPLQFPQPAWADLLGVLVLDRLHREAACVTGTCVWPILVYAASSERDKFEDVGPRPGPRLFEESSAPNYLGHHLIEDSVVIYGIITSSLLNSNRQHNQPPSATWLTCDDSLQLTHSGGLSEVRNRRKPRRISSSSTSASPTLGSSEMGSHDDRPAISFSVSYTRYSG